MPIYRFDKVLDLARNVKAFLNVEAGITRGALPDAKNEKGGTADNPNSNQAKDGDRARTGNRKKGREGDRGNRGKERTSEHGERIESKRQELRQIRKDYRAAEEQAEKRTHKMRKKKVEEEIFRLESGLRAAEEGRSGDGPVTGALPEFLVIGAGKAGTTFLYHLLGQHPHVEPAASKELHFFDNRFEEGVEWYRQCFPAPRQKDGRTTITGEATPFMFWPLVPERVAEVVPRARLVALLRNPVDLAYSLYHQGVRHRGEKRTFEEAVEAEMAGSHAHGANTTKDGNNRAGSRPGPGRSRSSYLSRGVYVDQLVRWAEYFDEEQMLVLKSEDFFGGPVQTLKIVLGFLGLPEWEPDPSELQRKRNSRKYEKMDPATRRRLEEYFEPHNKRLYDYLGRDLGW